MFDYFPKGIVLEQNKEPVLSRKIQEFCDETTRLTYMERPLLDTLTATPEQMIEIAKDANIIDESDGRPLSEKLEWARENKCTTVVADAIDDEPYISSQLSPTLQFSGELTGGLRLAQQVVGATKSYIAIYKNIIDAEIRIPKEIEGIPVERVQGTYPAEYRTKKIYRSHSSAVLGACALIHLYRAVNENRRQTTCFVTVAGDCVGNPCNLEVSIGMPIQQVLEKCGLIQEPSRIVVGGSMTGYAITDTKAITINSLTRGIVAFREDFKEMNYTCIGCGRCARVCPEGLSPYYMYKFVSSRRYKMLRNFDIERCTGCGTCSYVCPAKLDISTVIQRGKREVAFQKGQEIAARQKQRQADSLQEPHRQQ